ncbi:hypothetical protein BAE44_0003931 [Dichanthelium oligosanthes]|uniref:Neprosin PEP catalytic domain-containing protein n=1 Tax=Dichanthelium oligosanthes TaxID=888268 RepID=A0A1E5WCT8_9POAL|nr:hypothetical protein BAE44_0003931 [Dichanthelium oligosanthes]
MQHTETADSRKKKRRRRKLPLPLPLPQPSSSRSAAQGQCCCCSSLVVAITTSFSCCSQPKLMTLLLALALLLLLCPPHLGAASSVSPRRMARIQSHLDRINKPAVRSIRSLDGDIIDCVAAHEQHALDHPLLKAHTIQTEPPEVPSRGGGVAAAAAYATNLKTTNGSSGGGGKINNNNKKNNPGSSRWGAWQTWHHGGHCPRGTVAIRRTTSEDVLRASSISRFGRKKKKAVVDAARAANAPDVISGNGHEHAIAYTAPTQQQQAVYGAKATINVWDPAIQESNGFSLSQLWILSGSFNGSDLNSIEAGWQTSSRIAIGASISPVSSPGGAQYDMTLLVWKDPKVGNWWLSYGDQLVGYWPAQLFTHLSDHATMVEWGGEVVDTRPAGVHTATQMGSGRFADEGFGRASYFRNLETVDADNSLAQVPLDAIQTLAEDAACYDVRKAYDDGGDGHSSGWGTHFYYGGPGHNPACP